MRNLKNKNWAYNSRRWTRVLKAEGRVWRENEKSLVLPGVLFQADMKDRFRDLLYNKVTVINNYGLRSPQ